MNYTSYFDESVELAVSEQLEKAGIDVVSAHSLAALGDSDPEHLKRATEMGRVLCTYDTDFLIMAGDGTAHTGIIFGHSKHTTISDWVREIRHLQATVTPEEATGQIFYVKKR